MRNKESGKLKSNDIASRIPEVIKRNSAIKKWVTVDDISEALGYHPTHMRAVLSSIKSVIMEYPENTYGEWEHIQWNPHYGYRYLDHKYTGPKNEVIRYVVSHSRDGDYISGQEIADYLGYSKGYVCRIMVELIKTRPFFTSRQGINGGYLYLAAVRNW